MIHNPPYPLDQTLVPERKFADVLTSTYSRLDGLEARSRESIASSLERFNADPTDAIQWRAESIINDQVTLSLVTEIRTMINKSETIEAVNENFQVFANRYRSQIISWASQGETSHERALQGAGFEVEQLPAT